MYLVIETSNLRISILCVFSLLLSSCSTDPMLPWFSEPENPCIELPDTTINASGNYDTKYVFVFVIDGPRWSETWGNQGRQFIPYQNQQLLPKGVLCTDFINDGSTVTVSGHAAITTGCYEDLENTGGELPSRPSLFQFWLAKNDKPKEAAWIITSKDKLYVLGDCKDSAWHGKFSPSLNCGVAGAYSGYRDDFRTADTVLSIISQHHPKLALINFREPDYSAHQGNWYGYIDGIIDTDSLVWSVINFIEADPYYMGKTSYFITNDHGRHLNEVQNGFVSHGDDCNGCRKISLLSIGPDFKQNDSVSTKYSHVNLSATIAELMGLGREENKGKVMWDIFK